MARVNVTVTGLSELLQALSRIRAELPNKLAGAVYMEAEEIMTESKKQIPVDTAAAKNSGYVNEPEISGGDIKLEFGYGGTATKINRHTGEPTTTYLVPLHENLQARHTTGKAKFLEDPVKAAESGMLLRIARRLRGWLG